MINGVFALKELVHINALDTVLSFVYPKRCMFCRKLAHRGGFYMCHECEGLVSEIKPPFCVKCGKHMENEGLCSDCSQRNFAFDKSGALWPYEGVHSRAVLDLKFNGMLQNGRPLGILCAESIAEKGLGDAVDLIIPVPLSRRKMSKRGYNQTAMLAREIGRKLKIPVNADALIRTRDTEAQMNLSFAERLDNIKGSMAVKHKNAICGKNILLIDDIFTTGTTLNECAGTLKESGAGAVNCFCVCISYDSYK